MTLAKLVFEDLAERTASDAPTPGGGSIACLAGALGVALVQMALEVTRKSASTPELDAEVRTLAELRAELARLADRDVAAFEGYMAALGLPKASDDEKATRKAALGRAALAAADVPLRAAESLASALTRAENAARLTKRSVLSDVLAGADLLRGATAAALRNVDINLPQIPEAERAPVAAKRAEIDEQAQAAYARVVAFK